MAIKPVLVYPNPFLKQACKPVSAETSGLSDIIQDLTDTLEAAPGCVGISAPQIGYGVRVIIVDSSVSKRAKQNGTSSGRLICINPEIVERGGSMVFREGCLSVPDFTGNIIRSDKIKIRFLDHNLNPKEIEPTGFESVIFQHEIDHLDGILFLDRVKSLKTDIFRRKNYLS